MRLSDRMIGLRDRTIDGLLGIDSRRVLNPDSGSSSQADDSPGLAAELAGLMKALQADAFSERGETVDYGHLRSSVLYQDVRSLAARLRVFDPGSLGPGAERASFWINLYNALVIDSVVSLEVTGRVADGPLGILRYFRGAAYVVGGHRVSCEDIEHGILRANRGNPYVPGPHFASHDARLDWAVLEVDPRIHCALNCASRSCPPIRAYDPARLDAQLDVAARGFVDETVSLNAAGRLSVSSIFRWYAVDFGGREGVNRFLLRYLPDDDRRKSLHMRKDTVQLSYHPYDWDLNTP